MVLNRLLAPVASARPRQLALLASACLIASLAAGSAHAQSYTGYITLEPIHSRVGTGETVTFSGQLITGQGNPVSGATVYIKDDVAFGSDRVVKKLFTGSDGRFSGTWTAQLRGSGAWDFYAKYEGSSLVGDARSPTQSVRVSSSYNSDPASSSGSKYRTSITLDAVPASARAGDAVTFTGSLTSHGRPLYNALVKIYEDDPFSPDQRLGRDRTDSEGRFSVMWRAGAGWIETDFDVYAVFDGDAVYERDRTPNQTVGVYKIGGSITLDPLPSSANIGQVVTFSGTLKLDGYSPQGAAVYIKDEDPFSGDDLLATAYVKSDGRFSANWLANDVDFDNKVDIYAVFEGNSDFKRLTTHGGSRSNTIPLAIYGAAPAAPSPYVYSGNEYMELKYALDFYRSPHVAIVPSPDSYEVVRRHIGPVQEGVLMWTNQMEGTYGGDWGVTFEVLKPGKLFFDSKPDVVMNLVTYDSYAPCYADYYGVAYMTGEKPIQTKVCSTWGKERRSDADVSATTAHEFIHAVGLGHAFNKTGDMMCSSEDGVPTCDRLESRAKTPSRFSLAAVAQMYGADGFKNPNSSITRVEKFSAQEYAGTPPPEPAAKCASEYRSTGKYLQSGWYMTYSMCNRGPVYYSFSTDHEYDGFRVYVLPPETDVGDFVSHGAGRYYTCEGHDETWHVYSNTCTVRAGSNIVVHNTEDRTIRIDGYVLGRK